MASVRTVPWLELILGGGLALWITLIVLIQLGLAPLIAVLWLITTAIALIGTAMIIIGRERKYGKTILVVAGVIAFILTVTTTDVQKEIIPFCGDGACSERECVSGCADCDVTSCRNGVCEPAIERCDTSPDCTCPRTLTCAPTRTTSNPDLLGCVVPSCGDRICDAPSENRENCCMDCGCPGGYACLQNLCYFIPPQVGTSDSVIATPVSALSIAANPTLIDENGAPHAIAALTMNVAKSDAKNATVTFMLGNLAYDLVRLGDVRAGTETIIPWYLTPRNIIGNPLSIINDTTMPITVMLEYYDGQGVRHLRTSKHSLTITARDTIDAYGHRAFLVTPEDLPLLGTTPRTIWETIGKRVNLTTTATARIRFPIETFTDGQGTREEIAVLYATALQRAGLNPAFVDTASGTLVRVRDGTRSVMLDPTRIKQPYAASISSTPGFTVEEVGDVWIARNMTAPLHLTQALVPGGLVRSKLDEEITCGPLGPRTIAIATVYNDGLVPVTVCITTNIMRERTLLDTREQCITVEYWSRHSVRHGWQENGLCDIANISVSARYDIEK